jgi:hypothetical protein
MRSAFGVVVHIIKMLEDMPVEGEQKRDGSAVETT